MLNLIAMIVVLAINLCVVLPYRIITGLILTLIMIVHIVKEDKKNQS